MKGGRKAPFLLMILRPESEAMPSDVDVANNRQISENT